MSSRNSSATFAVFATTLLAICGNVSEVAAQCFPDQAYTSTGTFDYFLPAGADFYEFQVWARGADGGPVSTGVGTSNPGGAGATMAATFTVADGAKLRAFVGQSENSPFTLAGGGGSAVVLADTTVLVAAGGGGGASSLSGAKGGGGQANTNSTPGGGAGSSTISGGGGFNAAGGNATALPTDVLGGSAGTLTTIGAGGTVYTANNGGQGWGGGGGGIGAGAGGGGYKGGAAATGIAPLQSGAGGDSYIRHWGMVALALAGVDGGGTKRHGRVELSCIAALVQSVSAVTASGLVDFAASVATDIDFSDVTGSGNVTVERRVGTVADAASIPDANVYRDHFVITSDGTLAFSNAEIRFDVDEIPSPSFPDPSGVTIYQRSTPGSGVFTAVSTTYVPGTNEIVGTGVSSFSEFALGGDAALPVELSEFRAIEHGGDVVLSWKTESETDNAGFEVTHFGPSGSFEPIGYVAGHGTTADPQEYEFTIGDLDPGIQTFRLKQIDFDGAFEYSDQVEVFVDLPMSFVLEQAYPNPFNPSATIRFGAAESEHVRVALYDLIGRQITVLFEGIPEPNQMHEITIAGNQLPSGTYFVRMEARDFLELQSVVLLK